MNKTDRQSGVSLMLAVLVLSAITAIAFSLTTIIFIELRSAGDMVRGEPALYATLGITEQALFQYKRYVNGSDPNQKPVFDVGSCTWSNEQSPESGICRIGLVDMSNPVPALRTEEEVPKVVTVYAGTELRIPMYDLNDYSQKYGESIVELVPNGNDGKLVIHYEAVPEDSTNLDISTELVYLSETGTTTDSFTAFQDHYQYEMVLSALGSQNFLVSITTLGLDNTTPVGLPYIGKRALDVVANYLGVNRTYRVYIPVP